MSIILPSRFHQYQPQYPAEIDTRGLGRDLAVLFNASTGPVDLVTGRVWAPVGNAGVTDTRTGRVFTFDGVDDGFGYVGYPEMLGYGTFFCFFPVVGPPDSFGHVYFSSSTPSVISYQVAPDGKVYSGGGSGSSNLLSNWFNTTNRSMVLISASDTSDIKLYVDGKDSGITWASISGQWGTGNKNLRLGNYAGGASWDFSGQMLIAGWAARKWTQEEALQFHEAPFSIFRRPRRIWYAETSLVTEHDLAISSASQGNSAGTGDVTQAHALSIANAVQGNSASTGTLVQVHALLPENAAQGNTASTGEISSGNALAVADAQQQNTAATGTVSQTHALTVPDLSQPNTASTGAISGGTVINLTISASVQSNTAESNAIDQTHVLVITASAQGNSAESVSITQVHALNPASATQNNLASDGAVVSFGDLVVADLVQGNMLTGGNVTTTQTVSISSAEQDNRVSSGALLANVIYEAAMTAQAAVIQSRIKKPGIPHDTEQWLRTMLEIIIGRRNNKIEVPQQQNLTFSGTPTKAEVESLYAYTNQVRSALEQLINRLDS